MVKKNSFGESAHGLQDVTCSHCSKSWEENLSATGTLAKSAPVSSSELAELRIRLSAQFAELLSKIKGLTERRTAATANNIAASETLFRLGIAAQLIGQAGFIFVALALYDLLKGVNRQQASLMVTLIVVSIPIAFLNELNSIAALVLVRGADFLFIFEKPQRDVLAMLFLNLHYHGFVVAEIFWGLWLFPLALLVYRSRFLPRFLGVWLALAGFAWVILSLTGILLPQYYDKVFTFTQPAVFGEIAFMLWLVIKGAKPPALDAADLSAAAG